MLNIHLGDKVKIVDGSYMLAVDVKNNRLTRFPELKNFNGNLVQYNHTYIVVAINVALPADDYSRMFLSKQNNCIIKDLEDNTIWFCSDVNIKSIS